MKYTLIIHKITNEEFRYHESMGELSDYFIKTPKANKKYYDECNNLRRRYFSCGLYRMEEVVKTKIKPIEWECQWYGSPITETKDRSVTVIKKERHMKNNVMIICCKRCLDLRVVGGKDKI